MIEVEKKFVLNGAAKDRLTQGAAFVGEKTFTDVYYDTPDYRLGVKDWWLRRRDNAWELKVSLDTDRNRAADQYHEIVDEDGIKKALEISPSGALADLLADTGYAPFAELRTTRRKYTAEDFTIDLDEVTSSDGFTDRLGEIEIMVEKEDDIPVAIERIIAFAKRRGVETPREHGKVLQYLKEKKPDHYGALPRGRNEQ
jgi:predicted adenylyl cyclase CyaB